MTFNGMAYPPKAFLLGEGTSNRRERTENRLEKLARIFAIIVGVFSVLNNHLHVLARLDLEADAAWSDEEVVRRWARLCPPKDRARRVLSCLDPWVQENDLGRARRHLQTARMHDGSVGRPADTAPPRPTAGSVLRGR